MKVLLIVLVSVASCKLHQLDKSEPTVTEMKDMQSCQSLADQLDKQMSVRAFCIEVSP